MSFAGRVFLFCSPKGVISVTCKSVPIKLVKKKNASFSQKLYPEDSDQFQDLLRFRNISFVSGGSINSQRVCVSTKLEYKISQSYVKIQAGVSLDTPRPVPALCMLLFISLWLDTYGAR